MKRKYVHGSQLVLLCLAVGIFLPACGGGGGSGSSATTASQGTLSTSLTDSSTDEYQAVYVTIARIDVHHDNHGTWETVARPDKTYNLLELVNGVRETLGVTSLASGHYTQMRLIIGEVPDDQGLNLFSRQHPYANYIINLNDEIHELKVPSGTNTGLKIVNGFDINENQTTELLLDFDAMRSVVKAGSSGKYLLKPTIKVLNTADFAIVSGVVTDAVAIPTTPVEAALVTAQTYNPTSPDVRDLVVIETGTTADMNGEYALFLEPGAYNVVATQAGYLPDCTSATLQADNSATVDFPLTAMTTLPGTLSGAVSIINAAQEQFTTIDFRQDVTCVNSTNVTTITVKSLNIAQGGNYAVDLPDGHYRVVASTFDRATQFEEVVIVSGETTRLDITFQNPL